MHIHEFAGRKTVNMSNGTASIKLTSDEVQGEERLVMNAQAFVKRDASVKVNPNTKNTVSISFTRDDDEGWVQIVLDRDLAAEMVRQLAGDHGIV